MRKNFRGTAAACAVTILVTALSGCSGLSVDAAQGTGSAPVREPSSDPKAEQLGRPHNPAAGDNPRPRGADENAGGEAGKSDGKSSDESAKEKRGEPVGEGARPAGHEGLWFDSEPQDPWDKYVWKSQKFIGEGGEIPKLGSGTADKNFWGLPDLCSKQMQKRMREVGFEFSDRGANDAEAKYCIYRESHYEPGVLNLKNGVPKYSTRTTDSSIVSEAVRGWPFKSFEQVQDPKLLPDIQCSAERVMRQGNILTISVANGELGDSNHNACLLTSQFTQIILNLVF